jgi:hypothetical protein
MGTTVDAPALAVRVAFNTTAQLMVAAALEIALVVVVAVIQVVAPGATTPRVATGTAAAVVDHITQLGRITRMLRYSRAQMLAALSGELGFLGIHPESELVARQVLVPTAQFMLAGRS